MWVPERSQVARLQREVSRSILGTEMGREIWLLPLCSLYGGQHDLATKTVARRHIALQLMKLCR